MAKRKFAVVKKFASTAKDKKEKKEKKNKIVTKNAEELLLEEKYENEEYFLTNHNLKPPYNILIDTNFIHQSSKKKINMEDEFLRCLFSNANLFITECVYAELEILGDKLKVARNSFKTIKHEILKCSHKGNYADDCIINRVSINRCYIVATCDTGLKVRVRRIPGVPIMYILGMRYVVERMPVV